MTGSGEPSTSVESEIRSHTLRESTAPLSPTQIQESAASAPLPQHSPLHRGLLVLKTTPLALTHHLMPPGAAFPGTAWFPQDMESLSSEPATYPSRHLPGASTAPAAPSAQAPALVFCCSSVPTGGSSPNSVMERDARLLNPLFAHGFCKWPGCEQVFKQYELFLKHLDDVHSLGDRSTAQCLIQRERVEQLQRELLFERERLAAMQTQLRATPSKESPRCNPVSDWLRICAVPLVSVDSSESQQWDKDSLKQLTGTNTALEYYKVCNIRPPLTYAALIRWAILESPNRQLALNDIYRWFTRRFAYFRYNTATWKNAVRHNLSLHKCFVRLEDVKGAVWTVDELEYQRRQGRRASRGQETRWSPQADQR
ncbi:forkhead box protein P3 [Mobula hypostoma]|uniref:forkhead box protein P3 n=1 Tax=Mobula hypostoma TaxID=723540 RepID=UPI002FC36B28